MAWVRGGGMRWVCASAPHPPNPAPHPDEGLTQLCQHAAAIVQRGAALQVDALLAARHAGHVHSQQHKAQVAWRGRRGGKERGGGDSMRSASRARQHANMHAILRSEPQQPPGDPAPSPWRFLASRDTRPRRSAPLRGTADGEGRRTGRAQRQCAGRRACRRMPRSVPHRQMPHTTHKSSGYACSAAWGVGP